MSPGCSTPSLAEPGCTFQTTSMPVPSGCALRASVSVAVLQAQAAQFIVRAVAKFSLQRAARDRLALLDQLQRAPHALERQVEARGRAGGAAGVERHDTAWISITGEPEEPPEVPEAAWI